MQSSRAGADKASVTKPRCVLPGITYLLTRRCSERRFFLLPEPAVTWIFEYLLGLLSKQYGIQIHAYVAMSNHYHLVATDTEGRMPDFQRDLNSLLARAINCHWKRWEAFWDRECELDLGNWRCRAKSPRGLRCWWLRDWGAR